MNEALTSVERKAHAFLEAYDVHPTQEAFVKEILRTRKGGLTREQAAIVWRAMDLAWEAGADMLAQHQASKRVGD